MNKNPKPEQDRRIRDRIRQLYSNGVDRKAIEARLGCSSNTIRMALNPAKAAERAARDKEKRKKRNAKDSNEVLGVGP